MMKLNVTLVDRDIRKLIEQGVLNVGSPEGADDCVRPGSYDVRVGERMWRMPDTFLPCIGQPVLDLVKKFSREEIDLRNGAILERGRVYIVEMAESVNLDDLCYVRANAKSSSGRLNLQTRMITDGNQYYDSIRGPFGGRIYAELISDSFFAFLRTGTSLNQVRFARGKPVVLDDELYSRNLENPILYNLDGKPLSGKDFLQNGLVLSLDLESDIVGFKAKDLHREIDLQARNEYDVDEFWHRIGRPNDGTLRIDPGRFYILSTREGISLPSVYGGELAVVDPYAGRFSVHEAGFVDPAFGKLTKGGNNITLEVNSRQQATFTAGQRIGVLSVERMSGIPDRDYGSPESNSNYGVQRGPRLSKHFKQVA